MKQSILLFLSLIALSSPATAFNSNRLLSDPRPANQRHPGFNCRQYDIGTHAVVSRVAVEFLKSFSPRTQVGRAGRWIDLYASDTLHSHMPEDDTKEGAKDDPKENAFLRSANAPDLLNTTVDIKETYICLQGPDQFLTILIADIPLRLSLLTLARLAERLSRNSYLKAFFHHLAEGLSNRNGICLHRLDMPGELPIHLAGMSHCNRGHENNRVLQAWGYKIDRDPSVHAEVRDIVRQVLNSFVGDAMKGKARKILRRARKRIKKGNSGKSLTQWIADYFEGVIDQVLNWLMNDVLNKVVRFQRKEITYVGTGASRRPAWKPGFKRAPFTQMQFESATARADWWYDRAVYYQRMGNEHKAVLCLGHAAHYLQDLSGVPHHMYGYMLKGHSDWEKMQQCHITEYWQIGRHLRTPKSIPSFSTMVKERIQRYLGRSRWNQRDIPRTFASPSSMSLTKIYPLMEEYYRSIQSTKLSDPTRTYTYHYEGNQFRRTYWEHDLINATAATAWLIMKFYGQTKAKRRHPSVGAVGYRIAGNTVRRKSCRRGQKWDRRKRRCVKRRTRIRRRPVKRRPSVRL